MAAVGNAPASPTSARMRAPVLTATPGMEVRTFARGWAPSRAATRVSSISRRLSVTARDSARPETISVAEAVPRTLTVCSASALSDLLRQAV